MPIESIAVKGSTSAAVYTSLYRESAMKSDVYSWDCSIPIHPC